MTNVRLWKSIVAIQAAAFVASVYYCLYPFPYDDQVDWVLPYIRDGFLSIFAPHNEHRIPVPRLLVIVDLKVFSGSLIFVSIVALCALGILARILAKEAFNSIKDKGVGAATIAGSVVILLLLRGYTIPSYITPTIVQFILSLMFTALSLKAATQDQVHWRSVKAVAYGLAACGCGANGLVVFPALAWIAWRVWKNWHTTVILIFLTLLLPIVYFHGIDLKATHGADSGRKVLFLVEFFGVPWERLPMTVPLAILQGVLTIGTLCFFILRRAFKGNLLPSEAFPISFAMVLLASALMITLGRGGFVDLESQGSRYGVIAATAHAVLFILILPSLQSVLARSSIPRWLVSFAPIALSVFLLMELIVSASLVHRRTVEMAIVKEHICSGDFSPEILGKVYAEYMGKAYPENINHALDFVQALKENKYYCFD
jgi:hypothetical protein